MISVIIPAFNEVDAIGQCVAEVRDHLNSSDLADAQIVVVDDGSSDGSSDEARAAGADVLRNASNLGYGRAIKTALPNAIYDTVLIMDGDLTYPACEIRPLLAEYKKGYDMIVALRTGPNFRSHAVSRLILRFIVELVTRRSILDVNSGMRIFDRRDVYPFLDCLCDSFSFTTSLTLVYFMAGKRVAYRPIEYRKRVGKSKVRFIRDSARTLYGVLRCAIHFLH
jgi:glycosyltransferase involved in cell wall biosynthesis